jgi:hypothetical protein
MVTERKVKRRSKSSESDQSGSKLTPKQVAANKAAAKRQASKPAGKR